MDFNDGCVLLDLVYDMRKQHWRYKYDSLTECWEHFIESYAIDPITGRITELELLDISHKFDLPPIIERLHKLKEITLCNCRLIPIELGNLPRLEQLYFDPCPPENIPDGMQLGSLKSIHMEAGSFLYRQTFGLVIQLPALETLELRVSNEEEKEQVLRVLQNADCSFRQSLKSLDLTYCRMNEDDLETLLFNVLPRFPNLREISLHSNGIESLQKVERRIKHQSSSQLGILENRLCKLNLDVNPVVKNLDGNDPKEKTALLTILNAFHEISSLGIYRKIFMDTYSPDIEYLLRINQTGRKFITGGGISGIGDSNGNGETTATACASHHSSSNNNPPSMPVKRIRPELWPLILERAYENSNTVDGVKKCSTGIFYLLRNGSILQNIITLRQDIGNDKNKRGQKRKLDSK